MDANQIDLAIKEFISEAEGFVGTNDPVTIHLFRKATFGNDLGQNWCLGFVQYLVKKVCQTCGVASNLYRSEMVASLWDHTPKLYRLAKPEPGCLILWLEYKDGRSTLKGHVGIVTGVNEDGTVNTIEGNTTPNQAVDREGYGVFAKHRNVTGMGDMRVIGFLKCFEPTH